MKTIFWIRQCLLQMLLLAAAFSGDVVTMKCSHRACGYKTGVLFGGGMFFQQVMGHCRNCKQIVSLQWLRPDAPPEVLKDAKTTAKPKSMGEVWDSNTGAILTLYSCPTCKGPFAEIKDPKQLNHCPSCNQPGFGVDESEPVMIVD
jgi:Zn finger protein HypA/HybF involved in hydrogenase expression